MERAYERMSDAPPLVISDVPIDLLVAAINLGYCIAGGLEWNPPMMDSSLLAVLSVARIKWECRSLTSPSDALAVVQDAPEWLRSLANEPLP